ncbi:MAG: hypothetical protein H0T89_14220 [Deltaproteobacteria bacterium]|nr:hypothetical protein [Deltaproteobacteria bacterium]MDQ3300200.1 hypothetical protein [Myxococcota bacterium]
MVRLLARLRRTRWAHLVVANLRILIGFAFLPAALKKLVGEPFTDPANTGRFHDFLHAFHATGWFYRFVGVMQLVVAILLCTQRYALVGALLALPILTAITAFCWSTGVYPTATVATLMLLGTAGLVVWDHERWRGIFATTLAEAPAPAPAPIDLRRWAWCGLAVFVLYACLCLAHGGVYRPRGVHFDDPAFYVLPAIMLLPIVTLYLDRRAHRRGRATG